MDNKEKKYNVNPSILFLLPSFRRGGVERVTLNILNSIDTSFFDIHLIICTGSNNVLLTYLQDNIVVTELKKPNVRLSIPKIYKYINKEKPDVVFSSFEHINLSLLILKTVFNLKYKTIFRFNTLPSNELLSNRRARFYELVYKSFIKHADYIIAQSEEMKLDIIRHYPTTSSKIRTIRNLVDIDFILKQASKKVEISIQDHDNLVLTAIGSLHPVKGFDLLINSIKKLNNEGVSDIKLYIIGDNRELNIDYYSVLENMIVTLNLDKQIKLMGFKQNPFPYIKQSDAFVLSSRKEGFPNVVLEALALSKPCLVTDCIDFTGIIENGINGVIVEKDSMESLSEGIKKIRELKNKKLPSIKITQFDYDNWFKEIIK